MIFYLTKLSWYIKIQALWWGERRDERAEVRQKPGPRQSLMHISMRRRTARKKTFPFNASRRYPFASLQSEKWEWKADFSLLRRKNLRLFLSLLEMRLKRLSLSMERDLRRAQRKKFTLVVYKVPTLASTVHRKAAIIVRVHRLAHCNL